MSTFNASKIESYRCFLFFFVIFNGNFPFAINAVTQNQLKKINFRSYNSSSNYTDSNVYDAANLVPDFDKFKLVHIYLHGYSEHLGKESVRTVVDAFLWRNEHHIIAVDWSEVAGLDYMTVAMSVNQVAKQIAIGIWNMIDAGLSKKLIILVGHSMGVHICAAIARLIQDMEKIVGLDPAGPGFNYIQRSISVGPDDAKIVHIYHTDAGGYGLMRSCGTADFWVNNGKRVQPNCPPFTLPLTKEDFCSHHLSWRVFAESLYNNTAFMGVKCSASKEVCSGPTPIGYDTPSTATGDYYFITASQSPYGLGLDGAKC